MTLIVCLKKNVYDHQQLKLTLTSSMKILPSRIRSMLDKNQIDLFIQTKQNRHYDFQSRLHNNLMFYNYMTVPYNVNYIAERTILIKEC